MYLSVDSRLVSEAMDNFEMDLHKISDIHSKFIRLKRFVTNLIDNLEIGSNAIHVGMIVYSTLMGETLG